MPYLEHLTPESVEENGFKLDESQEDSSAEVIVLVPQTSATRLILSENLTLRKRLNTTRSPSFLSHTNPETDSKIPMHLPSTELTTSTVPFTLSPNSKSSKTLTTNPHMEVTNFNTLSYTKFKAD